MIWALFVAALLVLSKWTGYSDTVTGSILIACSIGMVGDNIVSAIKNLRA